METITIKEALKQGYVHAGKKNKDWQGLHKLEDLTDEDLEMEDGELILFSKEYQVPSITVDSITEMVADNMEDDWANDTGDDGERVYNAIKEVDFAPIVKEINARIDHIRAYKETDIQLVK